jgi:lipoprotein-anchoring transpeptidase ErfK/SrfK
VKTRIWVILIIALVCAAGVVFLTMNIKSKITNLSAKSGSQAELVNLAKSFEEKGNIKEAKASYKQLLSDFPGAQSVSAWQKKVEELNIKLLFSPVVTKESVLYEVKPGDSLYKIAKQLGTTVELIKASNNLKDDKIVAGRKIKVWNQPFNIYVSKSQNILLLKSGDEVLKTYTVATGANNSTPVGTFKITTKLTNPTWFKAGAIVPPGSQENILGTRWLGLEAAGYGIHGTTDPSTLGQQVTAGCVRMANPDVEELYTIVPQGTVVTIVD